MVICFPCQPKTKAILDRLVEKGTYSDYADVITAAVDNLAVLERASMGNNSLVFDHGSVPGANRRELVAANSHHGTPNTFTEAANQPIVPEVFGRSDLTSDPPHALEAVPRDENL